MNCTFWDMQDTVVNDNATTLRYSFKNCAFYQYSKYVFLSPTSSFYQDTLRFSNCYFDSLAFTPDDAALYFGPGNIFGGAAGLLDPELPDLHLLPCSPLRDAGDLTALPPWALTDIDGRPRVQDGQVDIGAYEHPTFGPSAGLAVEPTCAATGSVALGIANGCAPYTYQWQGSAGSGSDTLGLLAGTYVFSIFDAGGRLWRDTIIVPAADGLVLQAFGEPVTCHGANDASLSVSPWNGQPPYQYHWSDGASTQGIGPLAPGAYAVTATDAYGCTATFGLQVAQPDTLAYTATITSATSTVSADGTIEVSFVGGGTPPYELSWGSGDTSALQTGLTVGIYSLTITDGQHCTKVAEFEVKSTIGSSQASPSGALLALWPNPVDKKAALRLGDWPGRSVSVFVTDALGRETRLLVAQIPTEAPLEIRVADLPAGHYWLVVDNGEGLRKGVRMVVVH